jgi:hypothetical protein
MQRQAGCAGIGAAGANVIRTVIIVLMAAMACGAEARYIGTASCVGNFWVDSAGVSDHATIFENSIVETEGAAAKLQIAGGVRIMLDAHSRAQVGVDRLVLEKGRAQMDSGKDYRIEARGIWVSLGKPQSRAIVSVGAPGVVEVAALSAMVHVANAEGVAVANIAAGRAVELRLGETSEAAALTGCVVEAGGGYTLRDEASAVTVELRGTEVANQVGKRVHVTGEIAPAQRALAPAEAVVRAKAIQVLGSSCGEAADTGAMTESRARTAPQPDSAAAGPSGDAGEAAATGDPSAGSTAGSAGTAGTAGTAGAAGGAVGAVSAGIGVSTAVIAGVAVAAAAAGTTAAVVATQSHKSAISPGR